MLKYATTHLDAFFLAMLVFTPLAAFAEYAGASPVLVFVLSALAIVPLAKFIGASTEEIASRTTPALGGLLNATFGNATELIIGIMALHAGLVEVVKASITGSILGNLLLVLGTSMAVGGWGRERQTFNAIGAKANGSTLLLAATALVIPAVFLSTAPPTDGAATVEAVSLAVAALMILTYVASLFFSLHTHKHLYEAEVARFEPKWSTGKSVLILLAATLAVAFVSDFLVGSINPLMAALGWTPLFVGAVVVAIIGNVAEHVSAVVVALKNRMDLAVQISMGSATQVILLVMPVLVFISVFMGTPMTLVFTLFELVAIMLSVFVVHSVIEDGVSTWFEGAQLAVVYCIIAVAFFFHP
ncbi:MAG: calcium/proton exchanger [Patescibacteria group bacterium]|nr:calcium/proton exchanger [Patescibacteria group bacterium]MDE1966373.1 calcium/proton exchanger [Patescibacteria group bacterium]